MAATRIVIVDDHPLFREALRQALIAGNPDLEITEAGSLDGLIKVLDAHEHCDLILMDLRMPGVQGLSGLMYLRSQYPNIPVVIISANEDTGIVQRAVDLGASGFIPKSSGTNTIIAAVQAVLQGEVWLPEGSNEQASDPAVQAIARRISTLTAQQIRVLMMLKEGLLNKQIAHELDVSEATVKAHVSAILQKLGVSSRTQAVIAAGQVDQGMQHSNS